MRQTCVQGTGCDTGAGSDGCDAIDPATEEVNGELAFTSVAEVDEAVAVAKKAQVE